MICFPLSWCLPLYTGVYPSILVFTPLSWCLPFNPCVYPPILVFTPLYWCLPLYTIVYPSILVFTPLYWCLPLYTGVYPSILVFTPLSWCLPLYPGVYPYILVSTPLTWCLPLYHGVYPFKEKRKLVHEKKKKVQNEDKKNRVIAPIDFNPLLPKVSDVLNKHFRGMVFNKPALQNTFPNPLMAALRQPPNIRNLVCRSSLFQPKRRDQFTRKSHRSAAGWKKCGKGSITCCPYNLPSTSQVTGKFSGFQHTIKDSVNCETENCIYYWTCEKTNCKDFPRCEYVGLTTRAYRTRISEHKQHVRSQHLDTPSCHHVNQPGHDLSNFKGLVLEHVKSKDPFVLRAREFLYIQKFDVYRNGLNKEP